MTEPAHEPDDRQFHRTLIRVMGVQVVTLVLLWILQHWFGR